MTHLTRTDSYSPVTPARFGKVPHMSENVATTRYRQARDELLALRGKHEEAVASFTWPDLGERFNWAHDWFDVVARGKDAKALVIVE